MWNRGRPAHKFFVVCGVLVVVSAGLGAAASAAVRSPAQVLADTAPPPRSVLTEPVQDLRLSRTATFDARVERKFQTAVGAPSMGEGASANVVTRVRVSPGSRVTEGSVVVEVSGQPVIALQGEIGAYRAMGPSTKGPDVAQLQSGLRRLGYAVGDPEGFFGASTGQAVDRLYRDRGFEPTTVGSEELEAAQDAVRAAQRNVQQVGAEESAALQRQFAQEDLSEAYADLAKAQQGAGPSIAPGEIAFVPVMPSRVTSVKAAVGSAAEGELLTLSSGPLVVKGSPMASVDADAMRKGMKAVVLPASGGEFSGTIERVEAASPAAEASDGGSPDSAQAATTFTIVTSKPLPKDSLGSSVRVAASVETAPSAGLSVPVSAVSVRADGASIITVLKGKKQRDVGVTTGFVGDGMVQVKAKGSDTLRTGDLVIVSGAGAP